MPIAALQSQQPANVAFIRPELGFVWDQYLLIRDAIAGETAVKKAGDKYLPRPNAADVSKENRARYAAYLTRAVFYNVTRRTLTGLLGQVFMRDPKITMPDAMQNIQDDATGSGVSLVQLAKKAVSFGIAYSRCGILVDYPRTDSTEYSGEAAQGVTKQQQESGEIRPTLYVYSPMEIINWRVIERGAKEILSLVVLSEMFTFHDDGFEMKQACQFRVLHLDDETGNYVVDIYQENTPTAIQPGSPIKKGNYMLKTTINPTGADGLPLKEIPFSFIGSENNDSSIDDPNMYDMASLNIAHYRNSADYEESCFIVGQPTPVLTGLTQEWYKEVLKETVNFGSRAGIPLPTGADAKLLQAESQTMIKEAMESKELQMVALGAKLAQDQKVQRTAFEAKIEATAEGSVLSTTAKNVASAFQWALQFAAAWENLPNTNDDVSFELNTDYDISRMTPEEQGQVIKNWQAGAITFEEMRSALRNTGVVTEDDALAKAAIEKEQLAEIDLQAVAMNQVTSAANTATPPPAGTPPPAKAKPKGKK